MEAQFSDISTGLESWYATENGRYVLSAVEASLSGILDTGFGYHLLQLSPWGGPDLASASPINHQVLCNPLKERGVHLVAEWEELPLESDSVDALVAFHALEFSSNPHQVLREMQRVLTPQGRLVIVGFNPYSLLGAGNRLRGISKASFWHHHRPLGENRASDWMHLLGCEVDSRQRLYSLPPLGRGRFRSFMERGDGWCQRHNLALGGVYILHAIKQVGGINRPKAVRRRARLIDLAVPKPAAVPRPAPVTPAPRTREGDNAA